MTKYLISNFFLRVTHAGVENFTLRSSFVFRKRSTYTQQIVTSLRYLHALGVPLKFRGVTRLSPREFSRQSCVLQQKLLSCKVHFIAQYFLWSIQRNCGRLCKLPGSWFYRTQLVHTMWCRPNTKMTDSIHFAASKVIRNRRCCRNEKIMNESLTWMNV